MITAVRRSVCRQMGFMLASVGPLMGLVFGLVVTVALWVHVEKLAESARQQSFDQRISHANLAVDRVLSDITGLLAAVRSLLENNPNISAEAFDYAMSEHSQRLFVSGLQYIAMIKADTMSVCRRESRELPLQSGGAPSMLTPGCLEITHVYPRATNEQIPGPIDVLDSPARAGAIVRAMDFGYVAYTPPLPVARDNIASPGLLAYLPAYHRDHSLATVPARRRALAGMAVVAFSFEDLLRAELGGEFFTHIDMNITDRGLVGRAETAGAPEQQVLRGDSLVRTLDGADLQAPAQEILLSRVIERQHAGRNWMISFEQGRSSMGGVSILSAPRLVLLLGGLLTGLLYIYLRTLARGRKQAERLAERMTSHLREREAQLRQALDAAEMGSWTWHNDKQVFYADARATDLLGLGAGPIENLFEQIHSEDRYAARMALRRAVHDGRAFHTECRLAATVNGVRWVELSAQILLGETGDITFASGLVRNVTERYKLIIARRQLLNKLITTEEKERRRIARELHDQLGQEVTAISLGLRNLQEMTTDSDARRDLLGKLKQIASNIDNRVDRFTLDLRPVVLDDLGLAAALKAQFTEWSGLHGIQVNSHLAGLPATPLPFELSTTIFRVIQESLTNVARHSNATAVDVIVECGNGEIKVVVEDNGTGQLRPTGTQSHGLAGMRERVEALGGQFRTESTPGAGFSIFVRLPTDTMADNLVQI